MLFKKTKLVSSICDEFTAKLVAVKDAQVQEGQQLEVKLAETQAKLDHATKERLGAEKAIGNIKKLFGIDSEEE